MLLLAAAESVQLCLTLRDPIDSSPPGSSVPGILQARTLEWVAISFSNTWKWKVKVKSLSPTLSDPVDCSLPGSSVHGIFQAWVLEWGTIAFSTSQRTRIFSSLAYSFETLALTHFAFLFPLPCWTLGLTLCHSHLEIKAILPACSRNLWTEIPTGRNL